MSDHTQGWPGNKGPIGSLRKVGLWPHADDYPSWMRSPEVVVEPSGREKYTAGASFLSDAAIRALAALTFENWNVKVTPTDRGVRFEITRARKITL